MSMEPRTPEYMDSLQTSECHTNLAVETASSMACHSPTPESSRYTGASLPGSMWKPSKAYRSARAWAASTVGGGFWSGLRAASGVPTAAARLMSAVDRLERWKLGSNWTTQRLPLLSVPIQQGFTLASLLLLEPWWVVWCPCGSPSFLLLLGASGYAIRSSEVSMAVLPFLDVDFLNAWQASDVLPYLSVCVSASFGIAMVGFAQPLALT